MSTEQQPQDHAPADDGVATDTSSDIENNVKSRSTWLRLLFILIFFILWGISRIVVFAVVVVQFLWVLFSGDVNSKLNGLGQSLATYTYQIVMYLTYNSDDKPFPFDLDWPDSAPN